MLSDPSSLVVVPVTVELEREVGDGVVDGLSLLLLVRVVSVDEGVTLPELDEEDDDSGVVDVRVTVGVVGGVAVSEVSVGSEMVGVVTGSLVLSVGEVGVESLEPGKDGVEMFETPLPWRWTTPKRRFKGLRYATFGSVARAKEQTRSREQKAPVMPEERTMLTDFRSLDEVSDGQTTVAKRWRCKRKKRERERKKRLAIMALAVGKEIDVSCLVG